MNRERHEKGVEIDPFRNEEQSADYAHRADFNYGESASDGECICLNKEEGAK